MKKIAYAFAAVIFALALSSHTRAVQLYFGDLHSHTSYSDGVLLPADAYDFARYKAGVDFWTVSDHVERIAMAKPADPSQHPWLLTRKTALEKTENGKFVAIAGFEWATDWSQGHINVINTDDYTTNNAFPLKKFYAWIRKRPDALMGFNHPNEESSQKKVFDHFAYVPAIASQTIYVATNIPLDFPFYFMALDNGWRVGPAAQQDNHSADWGLDKSGNLTAVYADELTYASLLNAFRARRFYATNDRSLRIMLTGNGQFMGSQISADSASLEIIVSQDKGSQISSVKLISNKGEVVKQWTPGASSFAETVTMTADPAGGTRWFVALVEAPKDRFAISAPIWLKKQ